jgi:hypothetical protein
MIPDSQLSEWEAAHALVVCGCDDECTYSGCDTCYGVWPCPTSRLIAEVRRLRTELDAALTEGATIGAMLAERRPSPKLHPNATRERATAPLDGDTWGGI